MIVTDLDGTFLGEGGKVSKRNLCAAQAAMAAGIRFVVATGRPVRWLNRISELEILNPLVIANNGACIINDGVIEQTFPIAPDTVREVTAELKGAVPGISFALEYPMTWALEPSFARVRADLAPTVRAQVDDLPASEVLKLLAWHETIATEELFARVVEVVGRRLIPTFSFISASGLVELSAPGVTKASTLSKLLTKWKIPPARVAAFGDMPNDLEMLRLAGKAFVPENAHPDLKRAGFTVVDHHNQDGVGLAILKLLGGSTTQLQ